MPRRPPHSVPESLDRRRFLRTGGQLGALSLPALLGLRAASAATGQTPAFGRAKSCIVLFGWGGISHLDAFDLKPDAPAEVRGEFQPIDTSVPGIRIGQHLPLLAGQMHHLAVVRSAHHGSPAHGKGMYWNLTGHAPQQESEARNQPPSRQDWPSLGSMVSRCRPALAGIPSFVQLPYPFVDNNTLQAGENAGWLGLAHDPVIVRTPHGTAFGGVSRDLGAPVLTWADGVTRERLAARSLLAGELGGAIDDSAELRSHGHFRELALQLLLDSQVARAFELEREPAAVHDLYGPHIAGQSALLARRLSEAGVPLVNVICAAGDLNGSAGDHFDTHGNNFNRLRETMLPALDRAASALISDLAERGQLDETLVAILTEFGRTPRINGGAGRDHYPFCYSVVLAGGGIQGGQVYGSSDKIGAFPASLPCTPADLHATIFTALGISPGVRVHDALGRERPLCDGRLLPLFA